MSDAWPFTIHKNERFDKLIPQLCRMEIAEIAKSSNKTQQLILKEPATFLEILKIVFLLYITPNDTHIRFHHDKLITKGQFINLSFVPGVSSKAQEILNALITQEDDMIYEAAFNALIAVYIGSLKPLECIFTNTYIVELGRHTHEFDIFCGVQFPKCIIVETTRGFTKEYDRIEESYSWHFKKAIFRKWMIERLYNVQCQLWYITLQGKFREEAFTDVLLDELEEELEVIEPTNKLLESILTSERDGIQVIDLGIFRNTLSMQDVEKFLNTHLLQKIQTLLT